MVRDIRVKDYKFSSTDLLGIAMGTGSPMAGINKYSDPINGTIQCIYWKAGNHIATGSFYLGVSGTDAEGTILEFTSGTDTNNIGDSWVVYPRATTVRTSMTTISGANGYNEFAMIPVNSILRVVVSGTGVDKSGGELSIVYI